MFCRHFNNLTFLISRDFFHVLLTFAKTVRTQIRTRKNVTPDLDPNRLTLWYCVPKRIYGKRLFLKKIVSRWQKDNRKNLSGLIVLYLTLKAPITTAADYKFRYTFPNFWQKYGMVLHENPLPADDSHEIKCLIWNFWRSGKICNCPLLQIIGAALRDEIKVELAFNNSIQIMSEMCWMTLVQHFIRHTMKV